MNNVKGMLHLLLQYFISFLGFNIIFRGDTPRVFRGCN